MKCPKCQKDTFVQTKDKVLGDIVEQLLFVVLLFAGVVPGLLYLGIKLLLRKDVYKCLSCGYSKKID